MIIIVRNYISKILIKYKNIKLIYIYIGIQNTYKYRIRQYLDNFCFNFYL